MLDTTLRATTDTGTATATRTGATLRSVPSTLSPSTPSALTRGSAVRAAMPLRTPEVRPRPATRRRRPNPETRLLTVAIGVTCMVCALLVVYLAAYAHVCLLGIDQSNTRTELHKAQLESETLRDRLASLQSPDHVTKSAVRLGMTRDVRHVDYITPGNDKAALSPVQP